MKKNRYLLLTLAVVFLFNACATDSQNTDTETIVETVDVTNQSQAAIDDDLSSKNILQIAIGSPDHTTLVAGVQAAALETVLANNGPLTVFAPTNAAFDKLPPGTLDELLKPENKKKLAYIITFHAAPGSYDENNIRGVMGIGQATGDKVKVTVEDGVTYVNGAKVLGSVKASNGYVHVIDAVLLPPEE